jgi:CHAT domain-containing protein/Tfp pilus assembly protein PilF
MKTLSFPVIWITFFFFGISTSVFSQNSYYEWEEKHNKGIDALNKGNNKEAQKLLEQAYGIAQIIFEENDEDFYLSVYHLAFIYQKKSAFNNALKYYLQALKILERNFGTSDAEYISLLSKISIIHKKLGNYEHALEYIEIYNESVKNIYGNGSKKHLIGINNMCQIYGELGEYNKAIALQKKSLSLQTKKDFVYVHTIFTLAYLYHGIQEFNKEITLYKEAINIMPNNEQVYVNANSNLAVAYQEIGDYENALKNSLNVLEHTNEDDQNYPTRLQNLAYIYMYLGEFDKSLIIYNQALSACKNVYGEEHYLYGKMIDCVGQLYAAQEDYKKASELFKQSLNIFLKNFNENHPDYEFYLGNYANALLNSYQYEEAIALMLKNINILESNHRTDTEPYFRRQLALANAYNQTTNYDEALDISIKYIDKLKKRLGNEHPDYGSMLTTVSETYLGLEDMENAMPYITASNSVLISQIDKVFKFRSEKEKQTFLKVILLNFDEKQSIAYHLDKPNNALNEINLNNQIMLKGLLLNNSRGLFNNLSSLKNEDIDEKITTYRALKTEYVRSLSLPFEELTIDVDSLKTIINTKEIELVKLYSQFFNDENRLTGDWKLSQSQLSKKDIAIEFSHFHLTTDAKITDSIIYVAYLYKYNWDAPKMIPLFEEQDLKNITSRKSPNDLYNATALYNLIWKPLEQEVKLSKNIYYSPSGFLNQISMAALKRDKNISLSNLYNLVQLSNTGVLEKGETEPQMTNALFMGGITYDYKNPTITNPDSSYAYLNSQNIKKSRGTKNRGENWDYLPGTLKEIETLNTLVSAKQLNNNVLSGKKATEMAFKNLSGNSPNMLHIATHGFFYENIDIKPISSFNLSTEDKYRLAEDPLLRSGLILAGGNYSWKYGYNPNEDEDGILSALEISNMDLSKTDIVVLSACETGLGDINGSEGVYGLQRAFKMAGVNIIVMSLWKVPDNETAEFMTIFYEHWLTTKKVRTSFNNAQREMQTKYPQDPEKWAAFVLFE